MSGSQNVNELEILVKGNYLIFNVVIFKLECPSQEFGMFYKDSCLFVYVHVMSMFVFSIKACRGIVYFEKLILFHK